MFGPIMLGHVKLRYATLSMLKIMVTHNTLETYHTMLKLIMLFNYKSGAKKVNSLAFAHNQGVLYYSARLILLMYVRHT